MAASTESKKRERFTLKIGEIYEVEQGLDQIRADLARSRKARLSNLRPDLVNQFLPSIKSYLGHVEVQCPEEGDADLLELEPGSTATCSARWYQQFLGKKVWMGQVMMPTVLYQILWDDEKVHRIFGVTDPQYIDFVWRKNFPMRMEGEQFFATVYDRMEGLSVIREKAKKASVFRFLVVPPQLVLDLLPGALKGDYKLILSRLDPLNREFADDPDIRHGSDAKIYLVYGGEESSVGSIRLDSELYSIFWRGNKVYSVLKYESLIFANYFGRVFDTAWKYSHKVKS